MSYKNVQISMSVSKHTSNRAVQNAQDFIDSLNGVNGVASVSAALDRAPPRVTVEFAAGVSSIPDAMTDRAELHAAEIEDVEIRGDSLCISYALPTPHRPAGSHKLRTANTSTSVTLTPTAVEEAGFESGEKLGQHAREGEIVLRRW